jgi:RNA polymerase sigma factor (sigma-70 family)
VTHLPPEKWTGPPEADAVPRRRFRRSSPREFEDLCELHYRPILSYCRGILRSRQDAEDAVQETFLSAYRHLAGGDRPLHLKAWLYAIARNHCLMKLRRREGERDTAVAAPTRDFDEVVQGRSDFAQLVTDLRELPVEQREALVMFELGDLPQAHIATRLGCETARVKSLVFQARTALREMSGRAGSSLALIPALKERLPSLVGASHHAGAGVVSSLLPASAFVQLAIVATVAAGAGTEGRIVASSSSPTHDPYAASGRHRAPIRTPVREREVMSRAARGQHQRAQPVVPPSSSPHEPEQAVPAPDPEPVVAPSAPPSNPLPGALDPPEHPRPERPPQASEPQGKPPQHDRTPLDGGPKPPQAGAASPSPSSSGTNPGPPPRRAPPSDRAGS